MQFNIGIIARLDGPEAGSLPLPAGSLGQIWPVSCNEQLILFSHLCKMSYFCLFSVEGWAKPLSPGCCLAPLPRCEGVQMSSCSLCDPAKTGLERANVAEQGGLQCRSSVLRTNRNLHFLVLSIWHLSWAVKFTWKSEGKTTVVLFIWYSVMVCKYIQNSVICINTLL